MLRCTHARTFASGKSVGRYTAIAPLILISCPIKGIFMFCALPRMCTCVLSPHTKGVHVRWPPCVAT